jgi:predicted DCC family thiol-disulfide oxidoreductase YuxK
LPSNDFIDSGFIGTMTDLTIFYDGGCPLCGLEIDHLRRLDTTRRLCFEDIQHPSFTKRFPHINVEDASAVLHGQCANGDIILALDVTYLAWSLVGKRHWVAVLRWPLFAQIANFGYQVFAKHRHEIARLLTGKQHCSSCSNGVDL